MKVAWDISHQEFTIEDDYYFSKLKKYSKKEGIQIFEIKKFSELQKFEILVFNYPEKPFLQRLVEKGFPPTRRGRWCCAEYKENGGQNRMVVTGIRRAESVRRSNRKYIDNCLNHKFLHPILEWTENDIWEYIYKHNLPYCRLYDEGWKRIGCLFCPMRPYSKKKQEAEKYPKFYQAFIRAFKKMYDKRANGKNPIQNWKNGEEMFMWWIRGKGTGHPDQTVMFE